ncbi:MAG: DnaJ domain-containing protein [Cellvibrionaceae bacterium]
MIIRVILAIACIAILSFGFSFLKEYLKKKPKQQQKNLLFKFGFIALTGVLLILIATGRVHWISAIFAAFIPVAKYFFPILLRLLPGLLPLYKNFKNSQSSKNMFTGNTGNTSSVQTDYLKLILDHDTGDISGDILTGPFSGSNLGLLDKANIKELLKYYSEHDQESHQLLLAYAERRFSEDDFEDLNQRNTGENHSRKTQSSSDMTRKEALDILGLDESATEEEIISAHKKLMQKMHPDRGGSNYLAAKINEAKDHLMQ